MVDYFVRGGAFMWPILICLIIGLMFALERAWTLTRASINARKFTRQIRETITGGSVDKAIELCANTRGPVANVLHAGLLRVGRAALSMSKRR